MSDHLPHHLITNILSRLPSKSLLRFKTVCKSWYSLISLPHFIHLHSEHASQNPKIFLAADLSLQFQLLDFDSSCSAPLDCPMATPNSNFVKILGSCCGLVCVAIGHLEDSRLTRYNFFLWNPSTKGFRIIPDLTPSITYWEELVFRAHGLGYDPVSDDFKLVVADDDRTTYDVFSMKSNSWKSVAWPSNLYTNPRLFLNVTQAVVLNGVFHWLIYSDCGSSSEIIAFDSKQDKFLNVQLPRIPSPPFWHAFLLEHKGCLCISFSLRKPEPAEEIWMLKRHGWIRLLSISSKSLSLPAWCFRHDSTCCFQPIRVSSHSTRVILHNKEYIVRSTEEDEKFDVLYESTMFEAIVYTESLISPNHIQESEHQHKLKKQRRYIL